MNELYLSGSLKNKTINYYREHIASFDHESISFPKGKLYYDGSLVLDNKKQLEILFLREEKQILNYAHLIHEKAKQNYLDKTFTINYKDFYITDIIDKIIKILLTTNRKFTFVLFECLLNIINNSNLKNIKDNLDQYAKLLKCFINNEDLNQIEITLIMDLFLNNYKFNEYPRINLQEEKQKAFLIDENDEAFNDIKDIILLGEFIAPKRLKSISNDLKNKMPFTNLIAPLYFLIENPNQAASFLNSCRKDNLTIEEIEDIANKNKVLHLVPVIKKLH